MNKIAIENDVMFIIAEQIEEGYHSGMFDIRDDETGEYHSVSWSLEINIE